mmetsp:Transcript_3136/g.9169  ORF Transcript_3136/g.9169 Transcript_3136/m.9169 type:complete len:269 (-) Transcript_3136:1568-2374(-)
MVVAAVSGPREGTVELDNRLGEGFRVIDVVRIVVVATLVGEFFDVCKQRVELQRRHAIGCWAHGPAHEVHELNLLEPWRVRVKALEGRAEPALMAHGRARVMAEEEPEDVVDVNAAPSANALFGERVDVCEELTNFGRAQVLSKNVITPCRGLITQALGIHGATRADESVKHLGAGHQICALWLRAEALGDMDPTLVRMEGTKQVNKCVCEMGAVVRNGARTTWPIVLPKLKLFETHGYREESHSRARVCALSGTPECRPCFLTRKLL